MRVQFRYRLRTGAYGSILAAAAVLATCLLQTSALATQPVLPSLPDNGWVYEITGVKSGLCLSAEENGVARQDLCTGADAQRFQLLAYPGGVYALRAQPEAALCLGVKGGLTQDGAAIVRSSCAGEPKREQLWRLSKLGTGYRFTSVATEKCMVVASASVAPKAELISYACRGGTNEQFTMNKFEHSSADPRSSGKWAPMLELGIVPSSIAALPDYTLLYWSGSGTHSFHGSKDTHYGVFDLLDGTRFESVAHTGHEMFCPGVAMTADGRVLIAGGGGTPELRDRVVSYNFADNSWAEEASLSIPRWYSSAVTLGDGRVFTVGGDGDGKPNHANMEKWGEVWSDRLAPSSRWTLLDGIKEPVATQGENYGLARNQYYRRIILAPDGRLLEVAPSATLRWHDLSGKGSTSVASVRPDGMEAGQSDTAAQGAVIAHFSSHSVLLAGGSIAFGNEDSDVPESNYPVRKKSYIVDLEDGVARPTRPMRYPRYQANAITLPDGQVLVIGGAAKSTLFDAAGAIMAPELFDPAIERWTVMAPMKRPRFYHSAAVLLPDGRVWAGGGGQCNSCSVNEANAEIYSPPYLFKGKRPVLDDAPSVIAYGEEFTAAASVSDSSISRFTMVRMSATTHHVNYDQRLLEINFLALPSGEFLLTSPGDGNIAPPGYYMLFAISAKGVPSVAAVIRLGSS